MAAGKRGDQLLGPIDAIPIARDRLEAVVDADVLTVLAFQLLQDRRLNALGEDVARQQQDRYAVDGGDSSARDHIGCAGSDGGGAGKGRQAVLVFGVGDRREHLRLFVAALIVAHIRGVLFQRLADAGDVAVAEDAPHAGEEAVLDAIAGDVLARQVFDQRLRHGEADCGLCHDVVLLEAAAQVVAACL